MAISIVMYNFRNFSSKNGRSGFCLSICVSELSCLNGLTADTSLVHTKIMEHVFHMAFKLVAHSTVNLF